MIEHWDHVWSRLRGNLSLQPRCAEHPDLPCVRTLVLGAVNDVLEVDESGIQVRSHRTGNVDRIPASSFHAWWVHLQRHGTAALSPNDDNCPRSDRAVLVGAILARCLPEHVELQGSGLRLRPTGERHAHSFAEAAPMDEPVVEGARRTYLRSAYERDPEARRRCVAAHGTDCAVCGFSFGAVYGPEFNGYIHVHHLRPLSEVGAAHTVDPVQDLRPVCPNCHAVLHSREPALNIEDVRALLKRQRRI